MWNPTSRSDSVRYAREDYKAGYVAFIDVLGWKNIINQIGSGADRFDSIMAAYAELHERSTSDFLSAINASSSWRDRASVGGPNSSTKKIPAPKHLVASDTVILSAEDTAASLFGLLVRCGEIGADLLQHGFLTRGAIVRGEIYHQGLVIFGKALTAAYLQEKNSARYPRILIEDSAIKRLEAEGPLAQKQGAAAYEDWFRRDQDGFWRLNLLCLSFARWSGGLSQFLLKVAKALEKELTENRPGSEEFAKVHWLAETYNKEIERFTELRLIKPERTAQIDLARFRQIGRP